MADYWVVVEERQRLVVRVNGVTDEKNIPSLIKLGAYVLLDKVAEVDVMLQERVTGYA